MTKYTIEIDESLIVAKRDGSECSVDVTKIPESFFADFVTDGIAEYIRDSSSAALANAFDIAHPKHKHEGDVLKAARNKWVVGNVDAVAKESAALMEGARDRLYAGERRVVRGSTVDPLDMWRVKVLRAIMRTESGKEMKSMHDAIASDDQIARRDFLLGVASKNADWVDPQAVALKAAAATTRADIAKAGTKVAL